MVASIGNVSVQLRWCPPETFMMGSPSDEENRGNDETQHPVTLQKGFWMGETEVTQGLWRHVMGGNPSRNKAGDDYPVENMTWNDCQDFVRKLNARNDVRPTGLRFALPTEAQWEYACRAGTSAPYAGNGRLGDMGWHNEGGSGSTHPVGRKMSNAWGLHDMHGNVSEWCADWYGPYPSKADDPAGPAAGSGRVLRGGSCFDDAGRCRSAARLGDVPGACYGELGFRLVALQD